MNTAAPLSVAPALPSSRPALFWAAIALVACSVVLAAGNVVDLDVRPWFRWTALLLTVVAAVEDFRTRRIRNVLMAPALVLALAGASQPAFALGGALLAPLPLLGLSLAAPGAMGMGDVKLAAVAGALVGLTLVPEWWIGMALAGGVLGVIAFVQGGRSSTLAYGPALVASLLILML